MKKYDIITTHKSFEVESNAMLSALTIAYKKTSNKEELLAVVREDYDSGEHKFINAEKIEALAEEISQLPRFAHNAELIDGACLLMADRMEKELNRHQSLNQKREGWISVEEIKRFMKYMYHLGADNFEIKDIDATIDDLLKHGIASASPKPEGGKDRKLLNNLNVIRTRMDGKVIQGEPDEKDDMGDDQDGDSDWRDG